MPDYEPAVILSACRTPIGSFGGGLKDLSAADLGAVVIREAICRAGVQAKDLGDVIMGCVLQAGAGMNVARQAALKAGVPQEVPGGDGEPRLRLGPAGGRPRGRGHARRLHRARAGRRHRVDEQRAVHLEGGALGLPHGARRGARLDAGRGADLRDPGLPHGHHRGGDRDPVQRQPRGPGCVRRREPASRRGGHPERLVQGRDRRRSRFRRRKAIPFGSIPTNIRAPARPPRSWRRCGRHSRRTGA